MKLQAARAFRRQFPLSKLLELTVTTDRPIPHLIFAGLLPTFKSILTCPSRRLRRIPPNTKLVEKISRIFVRKETTVRREKVPSLSQVIHIVIGTVSVENFNNTHTGPTSVGKGPASLVVL